MKRAGLFLLILFLCISCAKENSRQDETDTAEVSSPLRLWEFMCKNGESALNTAHPRTWVEVKNVSDTTISLRPYSLSDKKNKPGQVRLEKDSLAPGEIVLVKDKDDKLNGDIVFLMKDTIVIDSLDAKKTYFGVSIGRRENSKDLYYFDNPTPGKENVGGFTKVAKNGEVHYTLDGSIPTMKSPIFDKKLVLKKTTVVRKRTFKEGQLPGKVSTKTYFVKEQSKLPIVSISMDPKDLYDEQTGIYVHGPKPVTDYPYPEANYWQPWERRAHIEFIDGKDGFSYDCGIKIFGGFSRFREKKSFQIKFRTSYDQHRLKYDIYGDGKSGKVKSLILRSGSQDDDGTMVRDEFFTTLMAKSSPTLYVQKNRAVTLYINGEYFGVYFIREKINKYFVANKLGVKPQSVTLLQGLQTAEEGTNDEYKKLLNYVKTHDIRQKDAYEYVKSKVDFQSLIDFKIGEYYAGNSDVGNVRFFKSDDPSCDGKWHWIYYDLDWGFHHTNSLDYYVSSTGPKASFNVLISRLRTNPEFEKRFQKRLRYHAVHTFEKNHALAVFDSLVSVIKPEMERNCQRWSRMSYPNWCKNVLNFRESIVKKSDLIPSK